MPDEYPSTDLSFLQFQSSTTIRMFVDAHGMSWWVAKDVCDVLGIQNSRDVLQHLKEKYKGVVLNHTSGGPQEMATVNEPGLYRMIMRSRKPEAEVFQDWIADVLTTLRRTGSYTLPSHEPQRPAIDIPRWQQRPHITLMQLKVFAFFYEQPRLWRFSTEVALATRMGDRQSRDFCKYFVDSKLCERMPTLPMAYRWSPTAETDNPSFLNDLLTARHILPLDVQGSDIPLWERENDPRKW